MILFWDSVEKLSNALFYFRVAELVFGIPFLASVLVLVAGKFMKTNDDRRVLKKASKWIAGIFAVLIFVAHFSAFILDSRISTLQKPRTLNAASLDRFLEVVQDGPKGLIDIMAPADSTEALDFAKQLGAGLAEAQWPIKRVARASLSHREGILLEVLDEKKPPVHAVVLQKAFIAAGFDAQIKESQIPEDNETVVLIVGYKSE